MDLLRCKLLMSKLQEIGLQDVHFQIMLYVEYPKIIKNFKCVLEQLRESCRYLRGGNCSLDNFTNLAAFDLHKRYITNSFGRKIIVWMYITDPKQSSHSRVVNTEVYHHNSIYKENLYLHNNSIKFGAILGYYMTEDKLSLMQARQKFIEKNGFKI